MANDLLYPMDARGSGQAPRPLAPPPRRGRGIGGFVLPLLVAALGAGGWLRLVRPLQQKLALTTRLLAQASGRAAALQQRVTALEAERTAASAEGEAAGARQGELERQARQVATLRDTLSAQAAPLVDQRRLQLLPHERGLAVHLPGWAPAHPTRRRHGGRRAAADDVASRLAEKVRPGLSASGTATTATAFACCPEGASRRARASCWQRAEALAQALASRWQGLRGVRVLAAIGPQDTLWSLPTGPSGTAEACTMVDLRPDEARP